MRDDAIITACTRVQHLQPYLLLKLFHAPVLFPTFLALVPRCFRSPPPSASEASSSGTAALSTIPPSAAFGHGMTRRGTARHGGGAACFTVGLIRVWYQFVGIVAFRGSDEERQRRAGRREGTAIGGST